MTIFVTRVLAAAGALWRRDRDLLVRIAVPFVLLPSLAFQLLVPRPLMPADTGAAEMLHAQWQSAGDHAGAYLLAAAIIEYGHAALFAFYMDPQARDVRGAMIRAVRAWPRFVMLAMLVELATLDGLLFFIAGRLLPAGAALIARPRTSSVGAIVRAIRMTAGQMLATSSLAAMLLAARLILLAPFAGMDGWLRGLSAPNPVALAIVDAAGAGANMLVTIAGVLVAVVLYRALSGDAATTGTGASKGT
ncbi:MAG: hypothetical protein ACRYFW_13865 [Janthinobacterium lividum]